MKFEEFADKCKAFLAKYDSGGSTDAIWPVGEINQDLAEQVRTEVTFTVCHHYIGSMSGYYYVKKLGKGGGKYPKTFLIDFEPTERPRMTGETTLNETYYYAHIKAYHIMSAPPRFTRTYYSQYIPYVYTVIYHKTNKAPPTFTGKSLLEERDVYSDVVTAGRISKSASRFLVPVQDYRGNTVAYLPLGNEELIFVEVLREAFRRRLIQNMRGEERRDVP